MWVPAPDDVVRDEALGVVEEARVLRLDVVEVVHVVPAAKHLVLQAEHVRARRKVLELGVAAVAVSALHTTDRVRNYVSIPPCRCDGCGADGRLARLMDKGSGAHALPPRAEPLSNRAHDMYACMWRTPAQACGCLRRVQVQLHRV